MVICKPGIGPHWTPNLLTPWSWTFQSSECEKQILLFINVQSVVIYYSSPNRPRHCFKNTYRHPQWATPQVLFTEGFDAIKCTCLWRQPEVVVRKPIPIMAAVCDYGLYAPQLMRCHLHIIIVVCQRNDAFDLWCSRRLLRISWIAMRSTQPILKKINPEYPLEGLMLKLKLQYFGHLMQRADSLEKTLMIGKTEGRRRRGQQRMRWLDGFINSIDVRWANSRREWRTGRPGVLQSMGLQRVWHNWATTERNRWLI